MPAQPTTFPISYWFIFQDNQLLLLGDEYQLIDSSSQFFNENQAHFLHQFNLGTIRETICYCAELPTGYPLPQNIKPTPLRKAFATLDLDWYTTIAKAVNLIQWDINHRYCGRCGTETIHKPPTYERACPACQLSHYPRISPSIIVLIHRGDEILMTRSPHFPPGVFGLVAGFVEVGESIEDAVHREVMEEVGLTITNLRYKHSQSWPFPDSLMVGFFADYVDGVITPDPNEIEAAGWYHYNDLPGRPRTKFSIAQQLIDLFIAERHTSETPHQP